jgi:hypothetical protein
MTPLGVSLRFLHRYTSNNSTSEILHENLPCKLFHEAPSTSHAKPLTRSRPITTAGIMSESSEHSRQHQADPFTPTSSISTLYSTGENFHALPQLLTKPALLEHSIRQQLAFIDKQYADSPPPGCASDSEAPCSRRESYVRFAPPARPGRRPYRREKAKSTGCSFGSPPGDPAPNAREQSSLSRTCSLDRGRDIHQTSVLSGSRSVSLPQHPLDLKEDPSIVEEDPVLTASLWNRVWSMTAPPSNLPLPIKSGSSRTRSSGKSTTDIQSTERKVKAPSPYDKDFGERVLDPRGIQISELYSMQAHKHFAVEKANGDRVQYYTGVRNAPNSAVWLQDEGVFVTDIMREYECMSQDQMCEAEFASYALQTILKLDPRIPFSQQAEEGRYWKTERRIELVTKPGSKRWICPPTVGKGHTDSSGVPAAEYAFDLRPDCAYWLSLQAFSQVYKVQIGQHTYVINRKITCPYLTIEFKRDASEETAASNQVAAAGALALYNRFRLREQSLKLAKQKWSQDQLKSLRHYGMTFGGADYMIWCIRASLTKNYQWAGCRMESVFLGNCTLVDDVRALIDWVNEIHCWGLTVHGPECQNDVKTSMRALEGGFRISDIESMGLSEAA